MNPKELAIATIRRLPDSATWIEIEERIRFMAAIEQGLDDVRTGRVVPHGDVEKQLGLWLSR